MDTSLTFDELNILYSAFDVPNFIKSTEPQMTEYRMEFFDRTKNLSTQLDNPSNTKQATQFFDRLNRKIDAFIDE